MENDLGLSLNLKGKKMDAELMQNEMQMHMKCKRMQN